jgi:hypothetical protein
MLIHASLFWLLVFFSMFKILGYYEVEWGTLLQWWFWNIFAYMYVAFAHFIAVKRKQNKDSEATL